MAFAAVIPSEEDSSPVKEQQSSNGKSRKHKPHHHVQNTQLSSLDLHAILSHQPTIDWVRRNRLALVIAESDSSNLTLAASRILAIYPAGAACSTGAVKAAAIAGQSPIIASNLPDTVSTTAAYGYAVVCLNLTPTPSLHHRLPTFYAWFLDGEATTRLLRLASAFVGSIAGHAGPQTSLTPPPEVALGGPRLMHVTAKFCGSDCRDGLLDPDVYASRADVARALGRAFDLRLTGLLLRPGSSLLARVELTSGPQLDLWDNDSPLPARVSHAGKFRGGPRWRQQVPLPVGSRAHVTLATAPGVRPVQAGWDLLDCLACLGTTAAAEAAAATRLSTRLGPVHCLDSGSFYMSLTEPLIAWSLFSGHY